MAAAQKPCEVNLYVPTSRHITIGIEICRAHLEYLNLCRLFSGGRLR